jgi:hypothetical protein
VLPWRRPIHSSTQGTADPSPNRVRGCRGPICYPSAIGAAGPPEDTIVTAIRPHQIQIERGGEGNQGLKQLIGLYDKFELKLIIAERQQMNLLLPAR